MRLRATRLFRGGRPAAIAERAGRLVDKTLLDSTMAGHRDANGRIDPKLVFEAALANDPLARETVRRTAEYIGRGLAILINVLDPQKIIIGGGVAKGGECLLGLIRQYMAQYTLHRGPKTTPIVLCPDLDNLPVVGAANLIFTPLAMNPPLSFVSPVSNCEHRAFSRTLRDLADLFCDPQAVRERLSQDNPVIYEFHEYVAARKREELVAATYAVSGQGWQRISHDAGAFSQPGQFC